jgi:VWFA-related protein
VPLAVAAIAVVPAATAPAKQPNLPEQWRKWLEEEVYPLIMPEQRKVFLALQTDEQRHEFAEQLWTLWNTESGMGSAFRREYEERLAFCREEYGNTLEDRARVMLLQGAPDVLRKFECEGVFNPLEIWIWSRIEGLGQSVTILFYRPYGIGKPKLWDPMAENRTVLYSTEGNMARSQASSPVYGRTARPEYRCGDGDEILRLLAAAEVWLKDFRLVGALHHRQAVETAGSEAGSARFLKFSTLVPQGAEPLAFELTQNIGGRRGGKVRVAFNLSVPREGLGVARIGEMEVVQLDLVGEISRAGEMYDRFRYAFTFQADSVSLPAVVEREVRPGTYRLRLKVQDANSNRASVKEVEFAVTAPEAAALPADAVAASVIEEAAQPASAGEAVLSLQGPEGESVSGVQRFTALASTKVARVEFLLDGRPVLTKNRPPFDVDLDLGPLPRLASVVAVAYGAEGQELDRRQVDLNVGRERFHVRLQPPGTDDIRDLKVRAVATVNTPTDRHLERVELYWNEQLAATLYQPPFEAWVPLESATAVGYLRVLAVLDDGSQAEDIQFVNAPQFISGVVVSSVHLPVTVLDKSKRPIEGLQEADFAVLEDGVPQTITHFSLQRELPVRLGVVVDTSGSMEKTLPEVQRVVLGFLRDLLRPVDRAFIIAFSDRPSLIQGFTNDFGALERALITLRPDRATALYDAGIYGLFQFSGVRGRKAIVVLTDGEDNASKNTYERVFDYAQRSGVIVYTIGIDLPVTKIRPRSQASRLARATGGESFFLGKDEALAPIYDQINRELRTQYQIVYTSNSTAAVEAFRKVTVKVSRQDVEVRTIAGYFPGD